MNYTQITKTMIEKGYEVSNFTNYELEFRKETSEHTIIVELRDDTFKIEAMLHCASPVLNIELSLPYLDDSKLDELLTLAEKYAY